MVPSRVKENRHFMTRTMSEGHFMHLYTKHTHILLNNKVFITRDLKRF